MNCGNNIFMWIVMFLLPFAAAADDFSDGVRSAQAGHWSAAETSFRRSVDQSPYDACSYYNLGTSLAAQGKEAEAIWALEKSLKLDPNLQAARNNIQYCYGKLGIPDSWEPALPYFRDKAYQFGIDNWTYITVVLGIVTSILIFIFMASLKPHVRKISLIFAVFSLATFVFSLQSALSAYHFRYSDTHAVMVRDESSVFNDATGNRRADLQLRGGTRYCIEGFSNGRVGLMMPNQMVVWIDRRAVRIV